MLKQCLLVIFVVFTYCFADSSSTLLSSNRLQINLAPTFNTAWGNNIKSGGYRTGVGVMFGYERMLNASAGLQCQLLYTGRRGQWTDAVDSMKAGWYWANYIEVGLLPRFGTNQAKPAAFFVEVGPSLAVRVTYGVDFLFNVGAGVLIRAGKGLLAIGGRYSLGLVNMSQGVTISSMGLESTEFKNATIIPYIGYTFELGGR